MSVQVGELHTEVSVGSGSAAPDAGAGADLRDSAEERALEAQCRADRRPRSVVVTTARVDSSLYLG
ncbi:MAG: hypothetical protein ACTHLJ_05180 [Angustibacter sp.]